MEVAGVVVGLLPIAFAGYKHFCGGPLSHYRRYSKEVRHYLLQLRNQRAFFFTYCRNLLSEAVDDDQADSMLKHDDHQCWSDQGVENQIATFLGHHWRDCMKTIVEIEDILQGIGRETELLAASIEHEKVHRNLWKLPVLV